MKTVPTLFGAFVILLSSTVFNVYGQSSTELPVRILPTTQKGIVKVLYAFQTSQSVHVKFFNEDGIIGSDKIDGDSFHHGFLKKYDMRQAKKGDIWVEISSPEVEVTYRLVTRGDHGFEPQLEKTTYNHAVVASNN
jgi:hypothetical protein